MIANVAGFECRVVTGRASKDRAGVVVYSRSQVATEGQKGC